MTQQTLTTRDLDTPHSHWALPPVSSLILSLYCRFPSPTNPLDWFHCVHQTWWRGKGDRNRFVPVHSPSRIIDRSSKRLRVPPVPRLVSPSRCPACVSHDLHGTTRGYRFSPTAQNERSADLVLRTPGPGAARELWANGCGPQSRASRWCGVRVVGRGPEAGHAQSHPRGPVRDARPGPMSGARGRRRRHCRPGCPRPARGTTGQ